MKTMTITRQLAYGFATITVVLLALAGLSLWVVSSTADRLDALASNTVPSLELLAEVRYDVRTEKSNVLDYVLADSVRRQEIAQNTKILADKLDTAIKAYAGLYSDSTDQNLFEGGVKALKSARGEFEKLSEQLRMADTPEEIAAATAFMRSAVEPQYDESIDYISKGFDYNVSLADGFSAESKRIVSFGWTGIIVAAIVGPLLSVAIGFLITRRISSALFGFARQLGEAAQNTAVGASQVGNISSELANRASEQAASVEETSASLEEMSSMTRSTAANAAKASQLASDTKSVAVIGETTMQSMISAMSAIETSSADVSKIVKRIDEIAFQTNILALNAAVEAARAGEAGAGFAVVADEVRSLAQRSAAAAKETAEKIDAAIANSQQGSVNCEKVGDALKQILAKVLETDTLVSEIASAADDQSKGIEQINSSIGQLDQVTQANAASSQQSASAAEELRTQTIAMNSIVASLTQLVGASAQGGSVKSGVAVAQPALQQGAGAQPKGSFI